jgi:hypothetical protein
MSELIINSNVTVVGRSVNQKNERTQFYSESSARLNESALAAVNTFGSGPTGLCFLCIFVAESGLPFIASGADVSQT